MACLTPEEIDCAARAPTAPLPPALAAHLAECKACRRRAEEAREQESLVRKLKELARVPDSPQTQGLPQQIGRYRILRQIGEGGMGVVYEAEQDKPQRVVALKVIRPEFTSSERLRRFELEAQVLGRLQHPGIAQIFEAGTADAGHGLQPYFAMELIRGQPLAAYVRHQNLQLRERLELVARICDAVQHAHQKGVIHRDLKSGNILVTEDGQPKILDFGVARLTDADLQATTVHTDIGKLVGTIPYMSPEQVSGDPYALDTRSDVYSLGIVLYELLTGRLPYDLSRRVVPEVVRVIREEEPTRLSDLDKTLRGDVETIVGKALEKERERRYPTAAALGADIRCYLHDEPIAARPASATYQLAKFARRHTGLVAGMAAVCAVLVAGAVVSTYLYLRAERNAEAARQQAAKAAEIQRFVENMFVSADPWQAAGAKLTVRQVVDSAADTVDRDLANRPAVAAAVHRTIGGVYESLGRYESATSHLRAALELAQQATEADPLAVAEIKVKLAGALGDLGQLDEGARLYVEASEVQSRLLAPDSPDLAETRHQLAITKLIAGELAEAEALCRQALETRRRVLGAHVDTVRSLDALGRIQQAGRHFDVAEATFAEAADMAERNLASGHPQLARTLNNWASLRGERGDNAGAADLLRRALVLNRAALGDGHPFVARSLVNLAEVLRRAGDLAGARQNAEEAERILRASPELGEYNDVWGTLRNLLGTLHMAAGDFAAAAACFADAVQVSTAVFGEESVQTAFFTTNWAVALAKNQQLEQAEPLARRALAIRRAKLPADHPEIAASCEILGRIVLLAGRAADAEPLLRECVEIRERTSSTPDPTLWATKASLGQALAELSRFAEAEPLLLASYEALKDIPAVPASRKQQILAAITQLYGTWATAEPDQGHEMRAAEWRARLAEFDAGPPPTTAP
jgi:tetratricopeptide (TPR) repeat protein